MNRLLVLCFSFLYLPFVFAQPPGFVRVKDGRFFLEKKAWYFIGTNYWYGGLIGNQPEQQGRITAELDFLVKNGIRNLRVLAGAEGEGIILGVPRVGPSLQPRQGEFNVSVLEGLDFLLMEMGKRNMKAVLYLSNNWEWSGGFLQYLNWNGLIMDATVKNKLSWDDTRDYVSRFYSCETCVDAYKKQLQLLLNRVNSLNKKKYADDPTIMAWEIANEPRPMRPAAIPYYKNFLSSVAAEIKAADKNHLVTIGAEGDIGTETMDVFESTHSDKNIDYLTIHIWPKNWAWYSGPPTPGNIDTIINKTASYINKHVLVAKRLKKPLVIEEFGLPRDGLSFSPAAGTVIRDLYFQSIFTAWQNSVARQSVIAGCNFWAFGGRARPVKGQLFWKPGDDYMGDPPMEEQGLYTIFDSDSSTWRVVRSFSKR